MSTLLKIEINWGNAVIIKDIKLRCVCILSFKKKLHKCQITLRSERVIKNISALSNILQRYIKKLIYILLK
jgi:hypothetical protein